MLITAADITADLVPDESQWWTIYVVSLYVTDLSNLLILTHSASNWLVFYQWSNENEQE